jgi:small subunit ribosomal protein S12
MCVNNFINIFSFILSTLNQLFKKLVLKKKHHHRAPGLLGCPQAKGAVKRPRIVTPRKPNSARRPVAKVLLNNGGRLTAHIPGVGHNIRSHSSVLVRGGGARDLPGVRYTCIRGVYDFSGLSRKKRRRSIYGAKKPIVGVKRIRRKFRFN